MKSTALKTILSNSDNISIKYRNLISQMDMSDVYWKDPWISKWKTSVKLFIFVKANLLFPGKSFVWLIWWFTVEYWIKERAVHCITTYAKRIIKLNCTRTHKECLCGKTPVHTNIVTKLSPRQCKQNTEGCTLQRNPHSSSIHQMYVYLCQSVKVKYLNHDLQTH